MTRTLVLARITLVVTVMAGLALASTARAGTYDVHVCRGPSGEAVDMSPWTILKRVNSAKWAVTDACPRGPFEIRLSPTSTHPANDYLWARFAAPADTTIAAYRLWRSVQLHPRYGWRLEHVTAAGDSWVERCYNSSGCTSLGRSDQPFASSNLVMATGLRGVTGLELVLTCALNDNSRDVCPASSPGARAQLHAAVLTMRDDAAPTFTAPPSGPLMEPGRPLAGAQPVAIAVADRGGGVYQAMLEVDGRIVATHAIDPHGGSCAPPFLAPVPCKLTASTTLWLNTATLADGEHRLRILVNDVTGTNVTAWGPTTIRTANGTCNPSPASSALRLTSGVRRKGRARGKVTVRYGRAVPVRGRLTTPAGAPVAGATVCVVARDDVSGAPLRTYGSVTTGQDGRFAFRVPKGPSRRVLFVHRTASGAVVSSVQVKVRAPVRLRGSDRALANGATLRLRGRLAAGPVPARGALVELQAWRAGRWHTFGLTRTDRRGRFRYAYTFTRTTGVQRYALRARVPSQSGYPYAAGASRPVRVTVRG